MAGTTDWDSLERQRYTNTGRLLNLAMRAFNERSMSAVRDMGHPALSFAHAGILPHIEMGGSRLTEIAERAGMRKQSASQLLGELEAAGYLARAEDERDRRAFLFRFTERGREFLVDAAKVKAEIEAELEAAYGAEDYGVLRVLLGRYPGVGQK